MGRRDAPLELLDVLSDQLAPIAPLWAQDVAVGLGLVQKALIALNGVRRLSRSVKAQAQGQDQLPAPSLICARELKA